MRSPLVKASPPINYNWSVAAQLSVKSVLSLERQDIFQTENKKQNKNDFGDEKDCFA